MRRLASLLVLAIFLFAAGCDSGGSTPDTLIGEWRGSFMQDNISYTMFLSLEQTSATQVLGTGTIDSSQGTLELTLSGTYAHPDLTLSFQLPNQRPATLQGTVSEDRSTIEAQIIGSDFDGQMVELERQ